MPHAKRSRASKNERRAAQKLPRPAPGSNSPGRLSAVCIKATLHRMAHVALATCPTHACHNRCYSNFLIKLLL